MMFCPKCKSIMIPKKFKGKSILACASCSYTNKKADEPVTLKEKIQDTSKKVAVVENEPNTLPLTNANCEKCGHNKAYYWTIQTRASDEPETKFLRCEKCNHTWREYD